LASILPTSGFIANARIKTTHYRLIILSMDKQKVLFITLSFDAGGAEKVLNQLIQNLHRFRAFIVTFYDKAL
jgi:hypothetical protein